MKSPISAKFRAGLFIFFAICTATCSIKAQSIADYRALIENHEGNRAIPYIDSMGHLTIGIGHQLTNKGKSSYSVNEINQFFTQDLNIAIDSAKTLYPNFNKLPKEIKIRLVDFVFNVGITRAKGFKKFNLAINSSNYKLASKELINSRYYSQVKGRAEKFSQILANKF